MVQMREMVDQKSFVRHSVDVGDAAEDDDGCFAGRNLRYFQYHFGHLGAI